MRKHTTIRRHGMGCSLKSAVHMGTRMASVAVAGVMVNLRALSGIGESRSNSRRRAQAVRR